MPEVMRECDSRHDESKAAEAVGLCFGGFSGELSASGLVAKFLVLLDSVGGFEAGTGRRDEQIMKPVVMVDKAV